jgi:hypothetical protein
VVPELNQSGTQSIVSCISRGYAWRPARRNEPRPVHLTATVAVNRTYLSKLEKGASYPGLENTAKLATVLEVDAANCC